MRLLIDCGASNGRHIADIEKQLGRFDKIIAIEANPELSQTIAANNAGRNIQVINQAVWIKDESVRLFTGDHYSQSSLNARKNSGNLSSERFIRVDAMDFSSWIKAQTLPATEVVCKMDIEGAEFDVLEKMISDKTASLVDTFLIEWHANRFPNKWQLRFRRFLIKVSFYLNGQTYLNWR